METANDYLNRAEWEAWWARHRRWVELVAPRPVEADEEMDLDGLFALIETLLEPKR